MKWRLMPDLVAYLVYYNNVKDENGTCGAVYFASPEKNQYQAIVLKQLGQVFGRLNVVKVCLDKCEMDMKLNINMDILVKTDSFPRKGWFVVENFDVNTLGGILMQVPNDLGDFKDTKFEVAMSETNTKVTLLSKNMIEYKLCVEELERRLKCEMFRKTKKWIPGHRYDTLQETYYYLGKVKSHKTSKCSTCFVEDDKLVDAYLYVKTLNGEKTVSEVLKNRVFGDGEDDIKITYSMFSAVDSGEVLVDDFEYDKHLIDLFKRGLERYKEVKKYGKIVYDLPKILEPLSIVSSDVPELSEITKEITKIIDSEINDILILNWNAETRLDRKIGDDTKLDENIERVLINFITNLPDANILRIKYYTELFNSLGINIKEQIRNQILNVEPANIFFSNFDNYIRYRKSYVQHHVLDNRKIHDKAFLIVNLRSCTTTKIPLKSLIPEDSELYRKLVDLTEKAIDSFGYEVELFQIVSAGTKKQPLNYYDITISIDDIINSEKGVQNVPENLKNDIINYGFYCLRITMDVGSNIK